MGCILRSGDVLAMPEISGSVPLDELHEGVDFGGAA